MKIAPALLLLALVGCAAPPRPAGTLPDTLVWSDNIAYGAGPWKCELGSVLGKDLVLVDVHGGTNPATDAWALFPDDGAILDANTVAWVLTHVYPPGTKFAFASCNRDGKPLRVRGVWYPRRLLTSFPYLPIPGAANNATDFVEGHP